MGRDKTGKKQEEAQLQRNNSQQDADRAARDKTVNASNKSIDTLEQNPTYTGQEKQAMLAEQAGGEHAIYGGAMDKLSRHAAQTGWDNDAGLLPGLQSLTRERGQQEALGRNLIEERAAVESLNTRRMIPGLRFQPATMYNSSGMNAANNNTGMINQRMQTDNTRPFWQDMVLTGMQAAGTAATGSIGGGAKG